MLDQSSSQKRVPGPSLLLAMRTQAKASRTSRCSEQRGWKVDIFLLRSSSVWYSSLRQSEKDRSLLTSMKSREMGIYYYVNSDPNVSAMPIRIYNGSEGGSKLVENIPGPAAIDLFFVCWSSAPHKAATYATPPPAAQVASVSCPASCFALQSGTLSRVEFMCFLLRDVWRCFCSVMGYCDVPAIWSTPTSRAAYVIPLPGMDIDASEAVGL